MPASFPRPATHEIYADPSTCRCADHDRLICHLDVQGVAPGEMARKIKDADPEMSVSALAIDSRLRYLEQRPELDYWRSDELMNKAMEGSSLRLGTPPNVAQRPKKKENVPPGGGGVRVSLLAAPAAPSLTEN